jgi:hypothetical protein
VIEYYVQLILDALMVNAFQMMDIAILIHNAPMEIAVWMEDALISARLFFVHLVLYALMELVFKNHNAIMIMNVAMTKNA